MAEGPSFRTDRTATPHLTAQLVVRSQHRVAPEARQAPSRRRDATSSEALSFRAAMALGSQLRMSEHRVVGIEIEQGTAYPPDPHVAVICLEDGRRIGPAFIEGSRAMLHQLLGVHQDGCGHCHEKPCEEPS